MKFSRYCACGNWIVATAEPDSVAEGLRDQWDAFHNGPQCRPTTAAGARAAQRKADRGRGEADDAVA